MKLVSIYAIVCHSKAEKMAGLVLHSPVFLRISHRINICSVIDFYVENHIDGFQ
jgi:hypothetical protein